MDDKNLYERLAKHIPNSYVPNELYFAERIKIGYVFVTKNQKGYLHIYKLTPNRGGILLERFSFSGKVELKYLNSYFITKDDEIYESYKKLIDKHKNV